MISFSLIQVYQIVLYFCIDIQLKDNKITTQDQSILKLKNEHLKEIDSKIQEVITLQSEITKYKSQIDDLNEKV